MILSVLNKKENLLISMEAKKEFCSVLFQEVLEELLIDGLFFPLIIFMSQTQERTG